jgi:hypothetical protein
MVLASLEPGLPSGGASNQNCPGGISLDGGRLGLSAWAHVREVRRIGIPGVGSFRSYPRSDFAGIFNRCRRRRVVEWV